VSALYKYALQKPWVRDLIEKRIAALRAVRETRKETGYWDRGSELGVNVAPNGLLVKEPVKKLKKYGWGSDESLKRRAFLKHVLEKEGKAPETFLVETKGHKYLVQPRGQAPVDLPRQNRTAESYQEVKDAGFDLDDYAREAGFKPLTNQFALDITGNVAKYGDDWKIIDSGRMTYPQPMDRQGALEKFISYGKRNKPWLD